MFVVVETDKDPGKMTKVCPEIEEGTLSKSAVPVSVDVSFASNHFPTYKLGPDNQIVEEPKEDEKGPSVKETVEKESELLSDQHKRLSVRDLASKFDKNLAAAVNLADEVKFLQSSCVMISYNISLFVEISSCNSLLGKIKRGRFFRGTCYVEEAKGCFRIHERTHGWAKQGGCGDSYLHG